MKQPAARNTADWHHAATNRGSQVERQGRARRARAESEVSDGVVAMSSVVQLRVCNASSKAKALVRTAGRIGWKAGELRSATRASREARSTAASINREMASRNLGRPDGPGLRFHAWRTSCLASRRFYSNIFSPEPSSGTGRQQRLLRSQQGQSHRRRRCGAKRQRLRHAHT